MPRVVHTQSLNFHVKGLLISVWTWAVLSAQTGGLLRRPQHQALCQRDHSAKQAQWLKGESHKWLSIPSALFHSCAVSFCGESIIRIASSLGSVRDQSLDCLSPTLLQWSRPPQIHAKWRFSQSSSTERGLRTHPPFLQIQASSAESL